MAKEHSMDVVSEFDFQELRNAIDQAQRECITRYDLKASDIKIELLEDKITLDVESMHQILAVDGIIVQKMINRKISPKILDRKDASEAGGMRFRQDIELRKALDQDNAKIISKLVRDQLPKVKASIQGSTVRLTSKSIDDLQAAKTVVLEEKSITVPIQFTNYR